MINSIGSSLAGLSAHSTKVNTVAHNVANINTEGYKKDRVTIHSNESGLPEAHITKVEAGGSIIQGPEGEVETSNVSLPEEAVNQIVGKTGFEANLKVLKAQEETIDSVLDILA